MICPSKTHHFEFVRFQDSGIVTLAPSSSFCAKSQNLGSLYSRGTRVEGTLAYLPYMTDTNQSQTTAPERLLSVTGLSEFLGIPVSTIYDWRTHGKGPMAYRLGKHLKFMVCDVKAWMALHRDDARNRSESQ